MSTTNQLAVMQSTSLVATRGNVIGEQVHSLAVTASQLRKELKGQLGLSKESANAEAKKRFPQVQAGARIAVGAVNADTRLIIAGFRFNEKTGRYSASWTPKAENAPRGRMAKVQRMLEKIAAGEAVDLGEAKLLLAGIAESNAKKAKKQAQDDVTAQLAAAPATETAPTE